MSTETDAFVEPWHGTRNGYQHHGCRCDPCKDANRAYMLAYNAANPRKNGAYERAVNYEAQLRRIERGLPDDDPRHGTALGYRKWGCRCDRCRTAATQSRYAEKAKAAAKQEESC